MLKPTVQHACLERPLCKQVFQAKRTITINSSISQQSDLKTNSEVRLWWGILEVLFLFFQQFIVSISNFPNVVPRPAAFAAVLLVREWQSQAPFQTSRIRNTGGKSLAISFNKPPSASHTGHSLRTTSLQKNKYFLVTLIHCYKTKYTLWLKRKDFRFWKSNVKTAHWMFYKLPSSKLSHYSGIFTLWSNNMEIKKKTIENLVQTSMG